MAEKRHNRQELIARDCLNDMTLPENTLPIDYGELNNRWHANNRIQPKHDELIEKIDASPLKEHFMDSRAASLIFDIGEDRYFIGDFHSFRFDVGNGVLLDFSLMQYSDKVIPEEWPFTSKIWRILNTVRHIAPGLKDGMGIIFDNFGRYTANAVDLFQRDFPPDLNPNAYESDESNYPLSETNEFLIEQCGLPYLDGRYSVTYRIDSEGRPGWIKVVFPNLPTDEELKWVSEIKPELEILRKEVSKTYTMKRNSTYKGLEVNERVYEDSRLHFYAFRYVSPE